MKEPNDLKPPAFTLSDWARSAARLSAVLFAAGLATSRLGLLAHELLGHGGVALALGGEVIELRLSWFGGGWMRWGFAASQAGKELAARLGGMGVEVAIGAALWLVLQKRDSLPARLARCAGAALVAHACWYFSTGLWHGYGDGARVAQAAGNARYPLAIAAGLVACLVVYAAGRLLFGALTAQISGTRAARIAGVVASALVAGSLQWGLASSERHLRADARYTAIMRSESERQTERELDAWQDAQRKLGNEITLAAREAERSLLAAQHKELPFARILSLLLFAAGCLGACTAHRAPVELLRTRHIALACGLALASLAAVAAFDLARHL